MSGSTHLPEDGDKAGSTDLAKPIPIANTTATNSSTRDPSQTPSTSSQSVSKPSPGSSTTLKSKSHHHDANTTPTAEEEYIAYVQSLTTTSPHLQNVVNFLRSGSSHENCTSCANIEATVIAVADTGSEVTFKIAEGHRQYIEPRLTLGEAIESKGFARKFVVCEDLTPSGAKQLGAVMGLHPLVLQFYLNRDAAFESHLDFAHVFEYPETYHSEIEPRFSHEEQFLRVRDHARRCTLLRMWKDVYGLFQRVVWAVVFNEEADAYVHVLLVDSLREPRDRSTTHLMREVPTFRQFKQDCKNLPGVMSTRQQLEETLTVPNPTGDIAAKSGDMDHEIAVPALIQDAITSLLCKKWELMIQEAQTSISESKAPLTGALDKIEEVLHRKHDLEKLTRTLSATIASVQTLIHHNDPSTKTSGISRLHAIHRSLSSWARQLERVSQSMLGMLAISESMKATAQTIRSKNLQLLAYIFLPISTVSSIYGMNTAEILDQTHQPRNWYFIVGAVVAMTGSAVLATLYHALPTPWFVAPIVRDPGAFVVDIGLLLAALVVKIPIVVVIVCLIAAIPFLWLALWVPAAVLWAVLAATLFFLKKCHALSENSEFDFEFVMPSLVWFMALPIVAPVLAGDEVGKKYLATRTWEIVYFYDVRHPLTIPGRSKDRRRWEWTRRDPKRIESQVEKKDSEGCVVM